jgi:hypothetical protein
MSEGQKMNNKTHQSQLYLDDILLLHVQQVLLLTYPLQAAQQNASAKDCIKVILKSW